MKNKMTLNYKSAGVNIEEGDKASKIAYNYAKSTFSSRKGLIGEPIIGEGGFSGLVNMGDFCLTQCCDTVGTKITIAEKTQNFSGLGDDLLAMVADDAICSGAEVIAMTNTFETNKVKAKEIEAMMKSLAKACKEQKIVISGGEVAEVGSMSKGTGWGADAVGILKKDKFITGKNIKTGQKIIGLKDQVLRSNGISLARKICEVNFGSNWHKIQWSENSEKSWGEMLLTPSKIFHRLLLDTVLGDFKSPRKFDITGIVHITGGGIPGNLPRIFPKNKKLGAKLDNLHEPHDAIKDLRTLGNIEESECYRTWHCGTAMMLICNEDIAPKVCNTINKADKKVEAKIVGEITESKKIELISKFSGKSIDFPL